MKPNPLIGKTIIGMEIAEDKESLRFILSDGELIAVVYAECCSHTWIEHVELPALGFPAVVVSADNLNMPDLGEMQGKDVVAYYGLKIVTDRGEIIIDYRNGSNGCYRGDLCWPGDYRYGGVSCENNSAQKWVALETKDVLP